MTINICPICHSGNHEPMVIKERLLSMNEVFRYARCNNCEAIYLNEEIKDFGKYYPEIYHNERPNLSYVKQILSKLVIQYNVLRKPILGKYIGKIFEKLHGYRPEPNAFRVGDAIKLILEKNKKIDVKNLSILDIGCGGGVLLSHLESIGFTNLLGIEPFTNSHKSYIRREDIDEFLEENTYETHDIIILSHVLEHLEDHEGKINKIKKLLKPNGVLIIAIPVLGNVFHKFKENTLSLDAPRHLLIHSLQSFELLIQKVGLKIQKRLFEQSYREIAGSILYSRDIGYFEGRKLGLIELNKKNNVQLAYALNKLEKGGSSVTFYIMQ